MNTDRGGLPIAPATPRRIQTQCSASAAAASPSSIPEIAEMQARAIFEAAVEAQKRTGKAVGLEVMVPLIANQGRVRSGQGADRLDRAVGDCARPAPSSPIRSAL